MDRTLNQNKMRSLSALRRALIMRKNVWAYTVVAGNDATSGSDGMCPANMRNGFSLSWINPGRVGT